MNDVEPIQIDTEMGMILIAREKRGNTKIDSWNDELGRIIIKIDEIPFKATEDDPDEIVLGLFKNIEFRMFKINDQYWLPRILLNNFHKNIAHQFKRLRKEGVEEFNRHWLEENEDYIYVDLKWFRMHFQCGTIFPSQKRGGKAVFLSPIGTIRLLSRASKTYNILYWLTVQYKRLRLIAFEYYKEKAKRLEESLKEIRKYMNEVENLSQDSLVLLKKLILQNINHLNTQVHYWYVHYRGDISFGYHPHQEIRKKWFWDSAEELFKSLNRINNNGKVICRDCGNEIKDKSVIHHFWGQEDYKKKKKWKCYFNPKECGLVHNKCHIRLHKKF